MTPRFRIPWQPWTGQAYGLAEPRAVGSHLNVRHKTDSFFSSQSSPPDPPSRIGSFEPRLNRTRPFPCAIPGIPLATQSRTGLPGPSRPPKIAPNCPVAESSVPPLPRTKSRSVIPVGWIVEILPGGGYQPRPTKMAPIPFQQLTPD